MDTTNAVRELADDMLNNNPSVGMFSATSRKDEPVRWVVIFAREEQADRLRAFIDAGMDPDLMREDMMPCWGCGLPGNACACEDEDTYVIDPVAAPSPSPTGPGTEADHG